MNTIEKLHKVSSGFLEIFKYCEDKKLENLMSQYEFEYMLVRGLKHSLYLLNDELRTLKYKSLLTELEPLRNILPLESAVYYLLDRYWKQFFELRNILLKDLESGVYNEGS